MTKLLTIVVPVYKVEPYINKCLDSCLIYKTNEQGEKVLDEELMNQLEVIIVNDGTPDNSAEMSREYVRRYPNTFRQIDKENGGHGSAWNVGLKEATGKYLRFLDSDDWLVNIERFMRDISTCEVDLVFTQLDKYIVEDNEFVRYPVLGDLNQNKEIASFPYERMNDYTICNFQYCTYRTELLYPFCPLFDEHVFYDDMILHVASILLSKNYIIFDYPLYQYLIGRAGQTISPDVVKRNIGFNKQEFQKSYSFYQAHHNIANEQTQLWAKYVLITHMSQHYISQMIQLPWVEFKKTALQYRKQITDLGTLPIISKQTRRLVNYPIPLFYLVEKIRWVKNQRIKA